MEKTQEFLNSLKIEKNDGEYVFTYTLLMNKDKKGNKLNKLERRLSTKGQIRLYNKQNESKTAWEVETFKLTERFDQLFARSNWKDDVKSLKEFMFYWNLLLQIRNSEQGDNGGFLQCPCCGFDSREGLQGFDFNGDANGAYNIARKGIIILNKIADNEKNLGITNIEWDNFSQK
jgi:CRISPR-associated protein Cpf1